jgi:translation elongation factor EF-4
VIERIPKPFSNSDELKKENLKAFLFDAKFIPNRGVQCLIKIMSGTLNVQFLRHMMSYHRQKRYDVFEVGIV